VKSLQPGQCRHIMDLPSLLVVLNPASNIVDKTRQTIRLSYQEQASIPTHIATFKIGFNFPPIRSFKQKRFVR